MSKHVLLIDKSLEIIIKTCCFGLCKEVDSDPNEVGFILYQCCLT